MTIGETIKWVDDLVWGPWLLILLLGTGIYLMIRMRFLPLRNLGNALRAAFGGEKSASGTGRISSFASLTTELAITLGTGNIIGVATAMVIGGPGALFWMVLTSFIGMATKLAESTLAVKYRSVNDKGEVTGGPMYTCLQAFKICLRCRQGEKIKLRIGRAAGILFAFFAVMASFGMGNMTQSNAIADALWVSFGVSKAITGLVVTILTILVVLGGIHFIGRVTQVLIPFVGIFYLLGTLIVILTHLENLSQALTGIFYSAWNPGAVSGGLFGTITVTAFESLRWGVSRGIFSNEAGLGASGITAAAADTEDYIKQGYISMTSVFIDTAVVCSLTGLAYGVSGAFQLVDEAGLPLTGTELTLAAFRTTFGGFGSNFISISIVLFAFATIIGWAYQGERAFEFLMGGRTKYNILYRFVYGLVAFWGCVFSLEVVWNFSDICNGLMAVPNLICVLVLSKEVCGEVCDDRGFDGRNF